ncbi:aprataxin and PNK-like factor isoform X2 [Pleuronectes platessa]|nr:aprataxin and PNK-like factor isoform X2 [Pleuronectes platessa]
MHMNPCFIQSSLTDDPRPLRRGSWSPLQDGDVLSLLPGQFIYQVLAVGAGEHTPRNSQTFEEEEKEEEERPTSPEPEVEPARPIRLDRGQTPPHEEPTSAVLSNEEEEEEEEEEEGPRRLHQEDSTLPKEEEDDGRAVSVMKKRVLPAWMTAAVAPISSSSPKVQSFVKRSKTPKLTTPTVTHSPEEAGLSEEGEEHPRKRRRKDDVTARHHGSSRPETSSESHSLAMEMGEEGEAGETSRAINTAAMTPDPDETESKEDDRKSKDERQGTQPSSSVSARLRPPCPYGKDCYRKNPVHFQETSHPGDSDFEEEEEEEEEEEDRPECPYGTGCYRKNPLHRKEYKHTKRAARSQTVPRKSPDEDEDEDEYDDSFIDDDSEDVGQDSDYVPPDSEDSSKEDVDRLQKEAQGFLKRRK